MTDLERILKLLGESLKTMAKGVNAIADHVDQIAKSQGKKAVKPKAAAQKAPKPKPKPKKKPAAQKAPIKKAPLKETVKKAPEKKAPAKPAAKRGKPASASATVLDIINNSTEPLNTAAIVEKTGYDTRKVQNIVFNLKKAGKIKSAGRGLYGKK